MRGDLSTRLVEVCFFVPKLAFGSKFNLHQNGHHWHAPFMLITMVQISQMFELSTMLGILG